MTETRMARGRTAVPFLTLVVFVGLLGSCTRGSDTGASDTPASAARASDAAPAPPPSDHAVYTAVLREHFMRPQRGEHALLCEPEEPGRRLAIVGTTQPLPPGTPVRDSGWAAELPAPASPLMAALRALDRQAGRALDADSLAVGVPIDLVPDSVAARSLRLSDPPPATRPDLGAPPLFWFSRVVYTADSRWALVYAVEACPGITEAMAADAENGAYERVILAPLEWRAGGWTTHPAVFLDIGLPRLDR
jgi:hypothetical protein